MNIGIPRLTVVLPPGRDYSSILCQTKMVYDQLLADKHAKLTRALLARKAQYDAQCAALEAREEKGHEDGILEFGVRAQAELYRLRDELEQELTELRADYQAKMNHMHGELELKWEQEQQDKINAESSSPGIGHKRNAQMRDGFKQTNV